MLPGEVLLPAHWAKAREVLRAELNQDAGRHIPAGNRPEQLASDVRIGQSASFR
jgi:hypothetical protein